MNIFRKMKRVRLSKKVRKNLRGNSGGFTLIEVLIALALFAIIAIVFAGGLSTASRAALTADIRTNAESLARTQMEYIKNQAYSAAPWDYEVAYDYRTYSNQPSWWNPYNPPLLSDEYAGYTVNVEAEALDESEYPVQEITVTVSHDDREVITLVGYKIKR